MWEKIVELSSKVFRLTTRVEQHGKDIEKLNLEIRDLNQNDRDLIIAVTALPTVGNRSAKRFSLWWTINC